MTAIPCSEIESYLKFIENSNAVCRENILLAKHLRKCFATEDIYVDSDQLQTYIGYQKYFPYGLFEWEKFILALPDFTYWSGSGLPRWPTLFVMGGRGLGKNGFISFEAFCLISPGNGIKEYDVDIFATAEDQAKTSFQDIYNVLESNKQKLSKFFSWNKEVITCTKTRSSLRFRTSNPKTKDGARPGAVIFDEYHAYENPKLPDVATTGLGKKPHPRRSIITTDGDVRDGELDKLKDRAERILSGEIPDNGLLPFINKLDDIAEIHKKDMWPKANPTLHLVGKNAYADNLRSQIEMEYSDYCDDPISHSSFATKRFNMPQGNRELEVTAFDNLKIASRELIDITNRYCVLGIDFASTQDFVSAGFLFYAEGIEYWYQHTWICKQSKDLHRIKFPYLQAEQRGECTIVDAVEIHPDIVCEWIAETVEKYSLTVVYAAIDLFRFTLMSKSLQAIGFVPEYRQNGEVKGNLKRIRPSDIAIIAPELCLEFARHEIVWGDSMIMRWYTNNAKKVVGKNGNISFEKIEPKSRKTDGFMALVAARTVREKIEPYDSNTPTHDLLGVWTF